MTLEEVIALPVYQGGFGTQERIIDGKPVRCSVLMGPPLGAFHVDDSTPMQWGEPGDPPGSYWSLIRSLDGRWWKRRVW